MAAVMNVIKRTLSISILRGQDVDGNPVTKSYVYSNVKPDVEPEKLLAVGKALGGLFDNDITGLNVVERATLGRKSLTPPSPAKSTAASCKISCSRRLKDSRWGKPFRG